MESLETYIYICTYSGFAIRQGSDCKKTQVLKQRTTESKKERETVRQTERASVRVRVSEITFT